MFLSLWLLTWSSANCSDQQKVHSDMNGLTEWFAIDWKSCTLALVVVWSSILLTGRHRGLAADRGCTAVRQRATNRGRDLSGYRSVHTVELRGSACVDTAKSKTTIRHHKGTTKSLLRLTLMNFKMTNLQMNTIKFCCVPEPQLWITFRFSIL